jgi:hypothetical protein
MSAWKTYLWLTFIGLCASTVNWASVVKDDKGKLRWGAIALQLPIAFSIGVMSHDLLLPLAKHVIPELSESISFGFASLLSFMGPLGVQKVFDGALRRTGLGQ